jgi:hypothetical protein
MYCLLSPYVGAFYLYGRCVCLGLIKKISLQRYGFTNYLYFSKVCEYPSNSHMNDSETKNLLGILINSYHIM